MAKSVRLRLWIAFLLVIVVIGCLIGVGVARSTSYYLTVSQALAMNPSPYTTVTVSGVIAANSVQWNSSTEALLFAIKDKNGVQNLLVKYHGARPQDFSNGWPVIVTGKMISAGTLQATSLEIKCPSKYEAKAPAQHA